MLRLFTWLVACALAAVVALAALLFQAVDTTPLVPPPAELSAASFKRVKGILRANDPRYLPPGASREVRIAGPELQALLDFAARHGLPGRAAIQLREGGAELRYTWPLPAGLATPFSCATAAAIPPSACTHWEAACFKRCLTGMAQSRSTESSAMTWQPWRAAWRIRCANRG